MFVCSACSSTFSSMYVAVAIARAKTEAWRAAIPDQKGYIRAVRPHVHHGEDSFQQIIGHLPMQNTAGFAKNCRLGLCNIFAICVWFQFQDQIRNPRKKLNLSLSTIFSQNQHWKHIFYVEEINFTSREKVGRHLSLASNFDNTRHVWVTMNYKISGY